ncbi:FAD-dependent monooxygenase, partial [Rhizobium ruizarguesonis]
MGFGAIIHSLEFADSRSDPGFAARLPDFVEALDEDSIGWVIWGARQNCPRDPSVLNGEQLRELGLELALDCHPHLR